jgi:shikimate kinase
MKRPRNIALVGYRGTGKTTVARLLAGRLGWDWLDADVELEARCGRSIREVFAAEGEVGFRDREEAVLADLAGREATVLATGGGAVLREANRRRLGTMGLVVWLTADAETIAARLAGDASTACRRPDLTARGGLDEIRELLAAREPFYRSCAQLQVDTAGRQPENVADIILSHWEQAL